MNFKVLTVALVVGIGLLIVVGPKLARGTSGTPAIANCYSDSESYSTPTLCE
jgi:hypothetical protein